MPNIITLDLDNLDHEQRVGILEVLQGESVGIVASRVLEKIDNLTEKLEALDANVLKVGQDIQGIKVHVDFKDIDDVDPNYDKEEYNKTVGLFEELFTKYPRQIDNLRNGIYKRIKDYEVRAGLSTNAYKRLQMYAENMLDQLS